MLQLSSGPLPVPFWQWQHIMKGSLAFLIWFCCGSLQNSVTCFTIPERLDRYTVITARNKDASHAADVDVPNGSNFTLLITAPIAAGIFLTVIVFFYCILFKDLTKKTGSDNELPAENYERLPSIPDEAPDSGFEQQQSSSTSKAMQAAAATNYGYVPEPGGEPEASSSSSNFQTTTASVER